MKPDTRFELFEKVLLFYFAILTLLIIFFEPAFGPHYFYILANIGFAAIVITVNFISHQIKGRWGRMLRFFMPLFLFAFMYREAGQLIHLIHQGWFDDTFSFIDQAIFKVNIGLWVEQFDIPVINELMRIGYGSYYFIIISAAIIHFFRSTFEESVKMMTTVTLVFCVSYLLFIIFPTQGPRFYHAHLFRTGMEGLLFSHAQQFIMKMGSYRGGAFPSSHIAATLVVWFSLFKDHKRAFSILTPLIILLILGTLWGRYHYAIDGIAGMVLGLVVWYGYPLISRKTVRTEIQSQHALALVTIEKDVKIK